MLAIGNNVALADRLAMPPSVQAGGGSRPPRNPSGWESHSISVPKASSGGVYSNPGYSSHGPVPHHYGGFGGFHHGFGPPSPYGMRGMHGGGMWHGHPYASQPVSPSINPLYSTPTGNSRHNTLYSTPTGAFCLPACPLLTYGSRKRIVILRAAPDRLHCFQGTPLLRAGVSKSRSTRISPDQCNALSWRGNRSRRMSPSCSRESLLEQNLP